MDFQSELRNLKPGHEFLIGIDSDGCVFDTMEVKQKQFFIPAALKEFELDEISDVLQETWEFVNLYSVYRGGNRFISLLKVFELLKERKEINKSAIQIPDLTSLKNWVKNETKLSNSNLRKYFESNYDTELEKIVIWTESINKAISDRLVSIPPFPEARMAIKSMSVVADLLVVSQTPLEALEREWKENDLTKYVRIIAGQEHGTKTEHISLASEKKYSPEKILMIGDAPGDLESAKNNGILFYPIIPGKENISWNRFLTEAFGKFTELKYSGTYETGLINEFRKSLPVTPPWI